VLGGRDKLVHAVRMEDGKEVWTFATRSAVDASPLIVGDRVFAPSGDGNLYLLDLATGKEVWKFASGSRISASPAIAGGRLVVSGEDGQVFCFDVRP